VDYSNDTEWREWKEMWMAILLRKSRDEKGLIVKEEEQTQHPYALGIDRQRVFTEARTDAKVAVGNHSDYYRSQVYRAPPTMNGDMSVRCHAARNHFCNHKNHQQVFTFVFRLLYRVLFGCGGT
jgi:hypothetical protein